MVCLMWISPIFLSIPASHERIVSVNKIRHSSLLGRRRSKMYPSIVRVQVSVIETADATPTEVDIWQWKIYRCQPIR